MSEGGSPTFRSLYSGLKLLSYLRLAHYNVLEKFFLVVPHELDRPQQKLLDHVEAEFDLRYLLQCLGAAVGPVVVGRPEHLHSQCCPGRTM